MNGEKPKITLHKLMLTINAEITAGLQQAGDQKEDQTDANRQQLGRFICVQVAGTELAIKLSSIIESGELSAIRALPLLPIWLPGITNIRGKIVSVIDLGSFLGRSQPLSSGNRPFLMVRNDGHELAITVQRILRTRILYQRADVQVSVNKESYSTDLISGRAWYKQDEQWHSMAIFDMDRFVNSSKLLQMAA